MQNFITSDSEIYLNTPQNVPNKTLIQLPSKQEMDRIQSRDRLNILSLDKQIDSHKRKAIPKQRLDNSVKSLSIKVKKQHEFNKFDISNTNINSTGKGVVPPEKLIKIIAPLKRHKSNKSSKKMDMGEEE